jgi:hypothetical protein
LFSQSAEKSIEAKLGDVQNSYDPSHPDYRFRVSRPPNQGRGLIGRHSFTTESRRARLGSTASRMACRMRSGTRPSGRRRM